MKLTSDYRGLQCATGFYNGYRWLEVVREVTRGYRGLQGVTRDYKELHGVTGGYKGLQEVTRGYNGL